MTKTDPAPMAPPLRAEGEEEEEEDEPVPEPPSPTQERRQKPVVHPSAPAPLPKDYGNHPPHSAIWPGALGCQGGLAELCWWRWWEESGGFEGVLEESWPLDSPPLH